MKENDIKAQKSVCGFLFLKQESPTKCYENQSRPCFSSFSSSFLLSFFFDLFTL